MKLPDMFDLRGRTVLVTGAASGLGLAIAEAMLEAGARAVLSDCDEQALGRELERLRARYPLAEALALDVARPGDIDAVTDEVAGCEIVLLQAAAGTVSDFCRPPDRGESHPGR